MRCLAAALAAGADRARLTDLVAHAMIDIRAQVWPNAAAPGPRPPDPTGDRP